MKHIKRDTDMLMEAYDEVLLNELNWKKALATGAAAAAIGLGTANAPSAPKFGAYTPKQAVTLSDNFFTDNKAGTDSEAQAINSVTNLLDEGLKGVVGGLEVSVIDMTGADTDAQTAVFNVSGDVLAYSQEEADSKATRIISKTLEDNHIKIDNLKDNKGQSLKSLIENAQRRFKVQIRVTVDLRSVYAFSRKIT